MERESFSPVMEPTPPPPSEPTEETEGGVASPVSTPDATAEEELTITEDLQATFAELKGEDNKEQKEIVTECLVGLVESGKMSVEELKQLIPDGILIAREDKEVPDHHRINGTDERQLSAAESQAGKLTIYPDFFRGKFDDADGLAVRQNILNHELGHLLHLRMVEVAKTDAEGKPVSEREAVIDVHKYKTQFEDVYAEHPYWQHLYPAVQVRMGKEFRTQECLAQDVADYLSAKDVNDWMRIRLRGMPSQDAVTGWSKAELAQKITAGELDDPVAAPFVAHAQEVWDFIDTELKSKRALLGQELSSLEGDSEEHDDAQWLHYDSSPAGNTHVTPSTSVDLNFLDKMYGKLFGAD